MPSLHKTSPSAPSSRTCPRIAGVLSASLAATLLLTAGFNLSGCAGSQQAASTRAISLSGTVHGGQPPVTGSTIQLYAVSTGGDGTAATPLLNTVVTTSDGSNTLNANANVGNNFNALPAGSFTISNHYPCTSGQLVYLTSTGGNPGLAPGTNNTDLALMAALGPCANLSPTTFISVNELTTVASIAALAPYMSSYSAIGSGTGDASALQSAFNTVNEYVNIAQGTVPGPTLPASTYASSYEIQTLGDALSACINSSGGVAGDPSACGMLFTDATPPSASAPHDTIAAALNIVKNPTLNVCAIYTLVPASPPFLPTLSSCPASWSLPITTLSVMVSGPSSVYVGATAQYTATVSGTSNQSVTWSVNGNPGGNPTAGTISSSGLYMPPPTPPAAPVTIAAVSALSSTASGSTSVTVQPVTVAVSGPADVLFGMTGQYSAVVTGNSSQSVTWLVNGTAGGSLAQGMISATGQYTAPASTPPLPVVIGAMSTAVTSATGTLGITVSPTALTYATGDTRTVTQPAYPSICATLSAQFTTAQRSSPPAAGSDDTTSIQNALNSAACKNTGKAVELAVSGSNNAFYSAELTLNGEGLIVDSGVTLEANNAYSSQSELLNINGANSSIMGPGIIDGRGDLASITGTPRLVQTNNVNNFIAYNITLQQAAHPNLYIQGGNGATVWGVTILTPATRANADGIDLDSLTNATVINSTIEAGDDGVAVKPNNSSASNITVTNNRLYGTHGLSIGSVPKNTISNVLFLNNYVYGTDLVGNVSADANGLVIKQDPACASTVTQVTYQNTCMQGVKHLITFYTNYSGTCSNNAGNPVFSDILVNGVYATQSISGAYSEFIGYSSTAPSNAALAYVSLDSNALNSGINATQYATISLDSSSLTSAILTGAGTMGMTTNTFSTPGSVPTCSF